MEKKLKKTKKLKYSGRKNKIKKSKIGSQSVVENIMDVETDQSKKLSETISNFKMRQIEFYKCQNEIKRILKLHQICKAQAISYEQLNQIYDSHSEYHTKFDKSNAISLYFDIQNQMDILKEICKMKMPDLKFIAFNKVDSDCEEVKEFLTNSLPDKLSEFYFYCLTTKEVKLSNYLPFVNRAATIATRAISICYVTITGDEFCSLIKVAKETTVIRIMCSIILTDNQCDFGKMDNCKIEQISLHESGGCSFSNWGTLPNRIINIIEGIAHSTLFSNSLQKLWLHYFEIDKKIRQNMQSKINSVLLTNKIYNISVSFNMEGQE